MKSTIELVGYQALQMDPIFDGYTILHRMVLDRASTIDNSPSIPEIYNKIKVLCTGPLGKSYLSAKNNQGLTPLHMAVNDNAVDVVEILLNSGADVDELTTDGKTSIDIIFSETSGFMSKSKNSILEVLLKNNAKLPTNLDQLIENPSVRSNMRCLIENSSSHVLALLCATAVSQKINKISWGIEIGEKYLALSSLKQTLQDPHASTALLKNSTDRAMQAWGLNLYPSFISGIWTRPENRAAQCAWAEMHGILINLKIQDQSIPGKISGSMKL
jgi:hypothetical protein